MTLHVGASGYSFPDWEGIAYPKGDPASERLRHYSSTGLNLVELPAAPTGSSRPPDRKRLFETSPDGFLYSLKLPPTVTHEPFEEDPKRTRAQLGRGLDTARGLEATIKPFLDEGRLACVLAQFPIYFRPGTFEKHYLESLREAVAPAPLAVEFRAAEWGTDETAAKMRDLGVTIVAADGPTDPHLLPLWNVRTSPFAYFRFHGRNPHWFETTREERYDYTYAPAELEGLASEVRTAAKDAARTFVVFNNCRRAQAFRNALQMAEKLGVPVTPGSTPLKQPELFG